MIENKGLLEAPAVLVKKRFGWSWQPDSYDLLDPTTRSSLGCALERARQGWNRIERMIFRGWDWYSLGGEYYVDVMDSHNQQLFTIHRFTGRDRRLCYTVQDASGAQLGTYGGKALVISQFDVFDAQGTKVCWFSPSSTSSGYLLRRALIGRSSGQGSIMVTMTPCWPKFWRPPFEDLNAWILTFEPTVTDRALRYLLLAAPILYDLEFCRKATL